MIVVIKTSAFSAIKQFISSALGATVTVFDYEQDGCPFCEIVINNGTTLMLYDSFEDSLYSQHIIVRVASLSDVMNLAKKSGVTISDIFNHENGSSLGRFSFPALELYLIQLEESECMNRSTYNVSQECKLFADYTLSSNGRHDLIQSAKQQEVIPADDNGQHATNSTTPHWEPPQGTCLSTVRLNLLNNGEFRAMHANTSSPVPFCTELFEGKVLLLVNSKEEKKESFVDLFNCNSYKFELQIQGKFRTIPSGPIFFGGEITKKMELGMITRGICGGLLQLGRSANAFMHHSFGDKDNYELPHIVGPFWSTVDRLVVTAPGDTPPPFMTSFPEVQKERSARKSNPAYTLSLNLENIYSFSMKTGMMNLEEWGMVAPMFTKSMSLSTFWADADLRFACYCVPSDAPGVVFNSNGQPKTHPQQHVQHFFCLEVQHVSNHMDWSEEELDPKDESGGEVEKVEYAQNSMVGYVSQKDRSRTASSIKEHEMYNLCENVDLNENTQDRGSEDPGNVFSRQELLSESEEEFFDAKEGEGDDREDHNAFDDSSSAERESYSTFSGLNDIPFQARTSVFVYDKDDDRNDEKQTTELVEDIEAQAASAETERVSTLLSEKLSLLRNHITSHSERHQLQPGSSKLFREKQQMENAVASAILKRSLIAAIIEVDDCRRLKKGKRRIMYAFLSNPHDHINTTSCSNCSGTNASRQFVLHSFGEWKSLFPLTKLPAQPPNFSRYSEDMKRKTVLAYSFETILGDGAQKDKLSLFMSDESNNESFLSVSPHGVGSKKLRVSLPPFTRESRVCVQIGNNTWSEECIGLCSDELIFIKPSKRMGTAVRLRVPLSDIFAVRKISEVDNPLPLPGCFPLLIATFAKQYTILVKGADNRDAWFRELQAQTSRSLYSSLPPSESEVSNKNSLRYSATNSATTGPSGHSSTVDVNNMSTINNSLLFSPSHLEGMVCYPPDWNLNDRMILNARNFTCSGIFHQLSVRTLELGHLVKQPCLLVEKLLAMAFQLADFVQREEGYGESVATVGQKSLNSPAGLDVNRVENRTSQSNDTDLSDLEQLWIDFMDGVALLQCIDLSIVDNTSPEAACLFMNLYHCMLLHSYMVVGLPNSLFKWSNFFRHCSYEAFGDIFSLSELEHCILRAGMSRPNINFLAQQLLIPNLEYTFALKVRDYRLLWGIFCGATSNVSEIPIYTPELLDRQLNGVTRASLAHELRVKDKTITLPVLCQLYAKEFDPAHQASAPTKEVLQVLLQYLKGDQRDAVHALIERKGSFSIKYSSLNFQCKYPTRCDYSSDIEEVSSHSLF